MKPSTPISAVMVHVSDWRAAVKWYRSAFAEAACIPPVSDDFGRLEFGGIFIEIVNVDEKVTSGPSGTVVYWTVENFEAALTHLLSIGARLYRGPVEIEGELKMCQVQDPWGNCLGIRGRASGELEQRHPAP